MTSEMLLSLEGLNQASHKGNISRTCLLLLGTTGSCPNFGAEHLSFPFSLCQLPLCDK